jgi:pimeloyl-ACP methyl ester carboxylesterase
MRRLLAMVALLASMVLVASCGSSGGAAAKPSPSARAAAGDDCTGARPTGTLVYFGGSGAGDLAGVVFGTGTTGIVFVHEFGGDACDWMPVAYRLSLKGYRTLVFDLNGNGASAATNHPYAQDVADAVTYLGTRGVTSVALVGSSMGGSTVLAAAAHVSPTPAAVISLSSPAVIQGSDALGGVVAITSPLLLMCGEDDTNFIGDVRDEYAAAKASKHKQLVVAPTSVHGRLLYEDSIPNIVAAFDAFLATYAPPAAGH